jgi:membrane protease YdiL (CAAX protease family)
VAITFAALSTVGAHLSARGPLGITAAEVSCVLLPTLVYVRARRLPAATLGLGRVPLLATALALVAGAATCFVMARGLEPWLERVWPTPPLLKRALEQMVGREPLALELVTLALVPAVAEELLFRGVAWAAWRPRLGTTGAIVATAIAFGLYHGSIHRFAIVAFAGLLLGVVRASSGSLWPAIAFHVANNAGVVIALRFGA